MCRGAAFLLLDRIARSRPEQGRAFLDFFLRLRPTTLDGALGPSPEERDGHQQNHAPDDDQRPLVEHTILPLFPCYRRSPFVRASSNRLRALALPCLSRRASLVTSRIQDIVVTAVHVPTKRPARAVLTTLPTAPEKT